MKGSLFGLGAAALFGVSTPLAKLLLPGTGPLPLASLLYLGAGLGLVVYGAVARVVSRSTTREAPLRRADIPLVAGIILAGGVLAPVLMLDGLGRITAVSASLLLNLEAPFTILLALVVFGEHLGVRAGLAGLLVLVGAVVLTYQPGEWRVESLGAIEIAGACLLWGLDNNLTQRLSLRDPVAIVRVKALGAGTCTLLLARVTSARWPGVGSIVAAGAVGVVCYGLSLVLDTYALRLLGAAREAAYFATAPFAGAIGAVALLGERLRLADVAAMALMAVGAALLLIERHRHAHTHEEMTHDHLHVHDEHHRHDHPDGTGGAEPHSHPHRHASLVHDHPHVPDLHHRHAH
ncbi:MAG: EamA family transporter [Acidobacteria bacterium]|nr:EamA family transporter [Acidobacteriota bacterium]